MYQLIRYKIDGLNPVEMDNNPLLLGGDYEGLAWRKYMYMCA